ncbi:MAG: helix-turn-helix domain-containing protein [Candidatus Dojkabacteria bacterium]|nr:helix-turn-helix domain-containing protein [Candidatus Dojkabacteria bacterium]
MITVGEIVRKKRESLNKTIEQISLDTKIQPRFLKYIESNDFDKFDSPIHAQGFIKIYTKYLNLNEEKILAIYRRSQPQIEKKFSTERETKKGKTVIKFTPKLIAIILSVIFLVLILSYIGYQIYRFQSPPEIKLQSPENDSTVTTETVQVAGSSDINNSVFINDTPVEVNTNGEFKYDVTLNPGINLITVLVKKHNSTQESIETLTINYEAPQEEEIQDQEEQIKNIVKLEIVNSSVWVELNVDKTNQISQILQVGDEYEYEVENTFTLTTGIINSTKIYFNDEELKINRGSNSVGSLDCTIVEENQINCE